MARGMGKSVTHDHSDPAEGHNAVQNLEGLVSVLALKTVKLGTRKWTGDPAKTAGKIPGEVEARVLRRIAPGAKSIPHDFKLKKEKKSISTGVLVFMGAVLLLTGLVAFGDYWVSRHTSAEWQQHYDWDQMENETLGPTFVLAPLLELGALLYALTRLPILKKLLEFRVMISRFRAYRKILVKRGRELPSPRQIQILRRFVQFAVHHVSAGLPVTEEQLRLLWAKADAFERYALDWSETSIEQKELYIAYFKLLSTEKDFHLWAHIVRRRLLWRMTLSVEVRRRARLREAGTRASLYGILLWFGPATVAVLAWKLRSAVPHGIWITLLVFLLALWAGTRRRRHHVVIRHELPKLDLLLKRLDEQASDFLGIPTLDRGEEPIADDTALL